MKLTGRLGAVTSMIPQGAVIADIGTDHGYVPVSLCSEGICPRAIAADIVPGPLEAAKAHVRAAGLADRIDCRLGDGLTCLAPGEADGAVICGMGGPLMAGILAASPEVWKKMDFLVLQPQSDAEVVRRFLYEQGWHIDDERLVVDDGRLYEILRAVPGKRELLPDWLYVAGPVNWQKKDPLLVQKIEALIDKKERIREGWTKSRRDMAGSIRKLDESIAFWREKVWQLQSEKS